MINNLNTQTMPICIYK